MSVEVTGRLMVDNSVILRDTLVAGLGLALTPHFIVQDLLASRKLVALLPEFMPPPHGVYGVVSQRRHMPLKTRVFLEFVEAALRECGYTDRPATASARAT